MIGGMLIIFLLLPESPWWLASKGKLQSAEKMLLRFNGHIEGYNVQEHLVSPPFNLHFKASAPPIIVDSYLISGCYDCYY